MKNYTDYDGSDHKYKFMVLTEAAKLKDRLNSSEDNINRLINLLDDDQKLLFIQLISELKNIETLNVEYLLKTIAIK